MLVVPKIGFPMRRFIKQGRIKLRWRRDRRSLVELLRMAREQNWHVNTLVEQREESTRWVPRSPDYEALKLCHRNDYTGKYVTTSHLVAKWFLIYDADGRCLIYKVICDPHQNQNVEKVRLYHLHQKDYGSLTQI